MSDHNEIIDRYDDKIFNNAEIVLLSIKTLPLTEANVLLSEREGE